MNCVDDIVSNRAPLTGNLNLSPQVWELGVSTDILKVLFPRVVKINK